jgi:amidohydrolase
MKSRLALLVLAATLSSPRLAIAQVQPTARPGMPKSIERSSEPRLQSSNAGIRFTSILSFPTANSRRPSLSPRRLRARLDVQTAIAHTGVVGILKGAMPGPVVAVRSELDALPVTEDTALPFKSTVRTTYNDQDVGVAHACGHDIHIAAILGVATVLASMREQLHGTVMFIFQPAEEGPPMGEEGGAELMLREGVFSKLKPEAVFGMHAVGDLDVGQIRYFLGVSTASVTDFGIEFHGKQAHAAFPQESVDPVVMAAEAVMALQTIRSRNLAPGDSAVLSVTMVHTGVRTNIIPNPATLGGTIRTLDDNVDDLTRRRMREIVESIAKGVGGTAELKFYDHLPTGVNNQALVKRMQPTVERVVGRSNVDVTGPVMAADDFALFAQVAPAFFFKLGTQKPGTTSGGNHTPDFLADDSSIPVGMRVMTQVLLEYLQTTAAH